MIVYTALALLLFTYLGLGRNLCHHLHLMTCIFFFFAKYVLTDLFLNHVEML